MASQNLTTQNNSYYGPTGQNSPVSAYRAGGGNPYSTGWSNYFQGYQGGNGYTPTVMPLLASPTQQQQPLNDQTALARLQGLSGQLDSESTGQSDGVIGVEDLNKALDDTSGKYSEEDKAVIRYMLDNQNGLRGRLDSFDGKGDGTFSVDTINKVVANPNAQPDKPLDQKMSNTEAFITLKEHLDGPLDDGKMDREELFRLKDDPNVSAEVRAAAKKIFENEELFKMADTGGDDDKYDGVIGSKDLDTASRRSDLDKIGVSTSSTSSTAQPVVQNTYQPVNTGNYNMDYYYNSVYGSALGPATDIYRQAMAPPAA